MKKQKLNWRVNYQIHASKVRVIDEKGKQIGIVDLKKAIDLAQKTKLDLVEIAPTAKPPVVRIVELGKFKYEQGKKLQKEKKKTKSADIKEVRLTPFIAKHDFANRLLRIKKFLSQKHKVRVVVRFKGREMGSKQFGYDLIKRVLDGLGENITVDMKTKFIGRNLITIVSPRSFSKKNNKS